MLVEIGKYWPALFLHAILLFSDPASVVILLLTESHPPED